MANQGAIMAISSDENQPASEGTPKYRRRLWWFCLACIAIINGCYVFEPVYWDMLDGMFMQAYWLSKNDLDYFGLLEQPEWMENGPCVYPSAWLSSLVYGGAYFLCLPPFIINLFGHVLVWMSGATVLYTVARELDAYCDWSTRSLACVLLFASPLFLSQTAAFNMEAPLAALSVLAFSCCLKRRYGISVLLAIIAFHIHPRGIIILLGNGAISVFDFLLALWHKKRGKYRTGDNRNPIPFRGPMVSVALHGFGFAIFIAYMSITKGVSDSARPFAAFGTHPASYLAIPEFTLAVIFFLFSFSVAFGRRAIRLIRDLTSTDVRTQTDQIDLPTSLEGVVFRSGLFVLVCVAFFLNVNPILPRYFLMLYPIVAIGIISMFILEGVSRRIVFGILIVGIGWNALNYRGLCYIPCQPNIGTILERSSEYHAHVELHQRLARYVETSFHLTNTIFVSHWPVVHVLGIPEAGYVTSPNIQVFSTRPMAYADIGPLTEIYHVLPDGTGVEQISDKEIVWIYSHNSFSGPLEEVYGREDVRRAGQLEVIRVRDRFLEIYKRPRIIEDAEFATFLAPPPTSRYAELPQSTWGKVD